VDSDFFTKLGTLRDPHLPKTTALSNWTRKLILDVRITILKILMTS